MSENYEQFDYSNIVPTWDYSEFAALERIKESATTFARGYIVESGHFYIEPWFYTQLTRLFERYPDYLTKLVEYMLELTKKHTFTIFTRDITNPVLKDTKYTLIEIDELIHHFDLLVDDNSRGSDYGD